MTGKTLFACLLVVALVFATLGSAHAHGLIGKRFFPATLAIDDPFVADEMSLPTFSYLRLRGSEDAPPTNQFALSGEISKRLTPDLGISLAGTFLILDPDPGKAVSGFDNLEVAAKYVLFKNAEHEFLLSLGLSWDVGGTGSKKVDAESFSTWTPQFFLGKGFGDLPDQLEFLKPFAMTAALGWAVPGRSHNQSFETLDDGSVEVRKELNPTVFQWGFTFQYSLQYLQSYVRDVGIPAPLNRMIPIVELALETPDQRTQRGPHDGDGESRRHLVRSLYPARARSRGAHQQRHQQERRGARPGAFLPGRYPPADLHVDAVPRRARADAAPVDAATAGGGGALGDAGPGRGPRVPGSFRAAGRPHRGCLAASRPHLVRWPARASVQHNSRRERRPAARRQARRARLRETRPFSRSACRHCHPGGIACSGALSRGTVIGRRVASPSGSSDRGLVT